MKKLIFFIFFFVFTQSFVLANQNKSTSKFKGCNYKITSNYLKDLSNLPIKSIEVDTHD